MGLKIAIATPVFCRRVRPPLDTMKASRVAFCLGLVHSSQAILTPPVWQAGEPVKVTVAMDVPVYGAADEAAAVNQQAFLEKSVAARKAEIAAFVKTGKAKPPASFLSLLPPSVDAAAYSNLIANSDFEIKVHAPSESEPAILRSIDHVTQTEKSKFAAAEDLFNSEQQAMASRASASLRGLA